MSNGSEHIAEHYSDEEYAEVIRKSYKRPRSKLAEGGVIFGGGQVVINTPHFPPPAATAAAIIRRQEALRTRFY